MSAPVQSEVLNGQAPATKKTYSLFEAMSVMVDGIATVAVKASSATTRGATILDTYLLGTEVISDGIVEQMVIKNMAKGVRNIQQMQMQDPGIDWAVLSKLAQKAIADKK